MTDQTPPTLDYQGERQPNDPQHHKSRKFFLALIAGTAVSAIVWFGGWDALVNHGNGAALFVVPGIKIVVAVTLLFFPRWRTAGIGLLISIPVGGLVFLGSCFANFRWQ